MARRFRFRLDTLLRLRRMQERQAQRSVGAARAELAQAERLIRLTDEEIRRQQGALRVEQGGAAPRALTIVRGQAWIAHLRRMSLQQHAMRAAAAQALEQALRRLVEARTRTRTVEKLREQRLDEFRTRIEKREDARLDDLARQMQDAAGDLAPTPWLHERAQ